MYIVKLILSEDTKNHSQTIKTQHIVIPVLPVQHLRGHVFEDVGLSDKPKIKSLVRPKWTPLAVPSLMSTKMKVSHVQKGLKKGKSWLKVRPALFDD